MAKRIALFNHKGGVSKTTTTFNLGWMLALKGKRVILVDADPQCNLTGLILGEEEFENFYNNSNNHHLKNSLAPAFEAQPKLIEAIDCQPIKDRTTNKNVEGLFLLPGHLDLSEYEVTLGIAQELSSSLHTLKNLPGSFSYLFDKTAEKYKADYVLIDMNPSLSSINQNLLITSHYFLVPTSPDYFSMMALKSLTKILPRWALWAEKASNLPILKDATYPFPQITPKLLGTVIQKYREYGKQPSKGFQKWIDNINKIVSNDFSSALTNKQMTFPKEHYEKILGKDHNYLLANFSDFNSLIALSQTHQTPIFALSDEQISQISPGQVLTNIKANRDKFENVFSKLADLVIELTN
jgi:cellulose biosynthesis protein BcsQ